MITEDIVYDTYAYPLQRSLMTFSSMLDVVINANEAHTYQ